jgi:hypothetical protein
MRRSRRLSNNATLSSRYEIFIDIFVFEFFDFSETVFVNLRRTIDRLQHVNAIVTDDIVATKEPELVKMAIYDLLSSDDYTELDGPMDDESYVALVTNDPLGRMLPVLQSRRYRLYYANVPVEFTKFPGRDKLTKVRSLRTLSTKRISTPRWVASRFVRLYPIESAGLFSAAQSRFTLITIIIVLDVPRSAHDCTNISNALDSLLSTTKAGLSTYWAPGLTFYMGPFDKSCFTKTLAERYIFLIISQIVNSIIKL